MTGVLVDLASTVVLLLLVVFLSTSIAGLVLRREVVEHDHFHTRLIVPILAIAACVVLIRPATGAALGTGWPA